LGEEEEEEDVEEDDSAVLRSGWVVVIGLLAGSLIGTG
jgi:hypothetical protein